MGRKRRQLPLLENVEIQSVGAEGKSVARHNDQVVFVANAIPGDLVDIQVMKKRRRYMEGKAVNFHTYSEKRATPFCEHFGVCGGCKWQFLNYEDQLKYKQQQVVDNLERIGHLDLPEITPIKAAATTKFYRNKLEYTFSNKRWLTEEEINSETDFSNKEALGFHIKGMFDKILDINQCHLQADPSNDIRLATKKYALENELSFFDLRNQNGLLRNLIIRTSSTGEVMVIVCFFHEDVSKREGLLNHLKEQFPAITSLMYIINEKKNDSIQDQEVLPFAGRNYIMEEMDGLQFRIGPKSFYQTNSAQAHELYKIAKDFASLKGDEVVYDLYTGTGTIANFVARDVKKVVGIEYVPEAIADAFKNSEHNNISNADFYAGDMKDVLNDEFIEKHGKPDLIITDPPRAGMHQDVVNKILEVAPKKVVYVSCNPASQARDLEWMKEKYKVSKVQAVDMFPHTHHVENVVLLELI